ncbi:MAG TPA: hypothetical protein VM889_02040 [Candidatus Thermoplasmatota archaeon]|nr:hypothetical protein [Candidatus Thermoplasmatota archaeon]
MRAQRAADIERALAERLARENGVVSVALMGSFAKGNPAFDEKRGVFTSDLDALVVVKPAAYPRFVLRQRAIAASLEGALRLSVSVAPLTPRLLATAPASVWFAEVRFGGRTIHGPDLLATIPIAKPSDVAPTEGVVVALNYLQELARLRLDGASGEPGHVAKVARALLGASDALAAAGGFYDAALDRRVQGVLASKDLEARAPAFLARFRDASARAFAARRDPAPLEAVAFEAWWNEARATLVDATLLAAGAAERDAPDAARATLAQALRAADGPGAALSFAILSAVHAKRPWPLLAVATRRPASVRAALFDAMREAPGPGWAGVVQPILARWRAASPAYTPFARRLKNV